MIFFKEESCPPVPGFPAQPYVYGRIRYTDLRTGSESSGHEGAGRKAEMWIMRKESIEIWQVYQAQAAYPAAID